MNLLVCISNVPDTTAKITFTSDNTQLNTSGLQYILNPYDEIALAKALELTENGNGSVAVIHVGEASAEPTIRKALAIGAGEAVRIDAQAQEAYFVAQQIAAYAKSKAFDIIFTGRESIDYNGSETGAMLAELLDIPSISGIKKLIIQGNTAIVERQVETGTEVVEMQTPFVVSCTEGLAEPKIPNMRGIMSARTKPLQVIEPVPTQSLTRINTYETPPARGGIKMLQPDETAKLVELLHTEAKVI